MGFTVELKYPNHKQKLIRNGDISHSGQVGNMIATTKKGSQQTTKAPVMMASVLTALRSRLQFVSIKVFRFFKIDGLSLPGEYFGFPIRLFFFGVVIVGGG